VNQESFMILIFGKTSRISDKTIRKVFEQIYYLNRLVILLAIWDYIISFNMFWLECDYR